MYVPEFGLLLEVTCPCSLCKRDRERTREKIIAEANKNLWPSIFLHQRMVSVTVHVLEYDAVYFHIGAKRFRGTHVSSLRQYFSFNNLIEPFNMNTDSKLTPWSKAHFREDMSCSDYQESHHV
jgi:hypothetical protein